MTHPLPLNPDAMLTLAQGGLSVFTVPTPPPLKSAPIWETYVLEQPWPLVAILVVVAIVLFVKGRGKARKVGPPIAILAAIAVALAGSFVTTARETMIASARALVAAVVAADASTLDAQLDPDALLFSFRHKAGVPKFAIIDEVVDRFRSGGEYSIKEHGILNIDASQDGQRVGRVQLKLRVVSAQLGVPVFSWWLLDYRRDSSGQWRVLRMEPQSISGVPEARAK